MPGIKEETDIKILQQNSFFYHTCPEQTLTHLVHYLHVGKLLHGREAGEIEPGHVLPVFVVISLVLQIPERCTPQPVQLQSILLSAWTRHNIYIYMQGEQKERNIYINMST